MAMKNSTVRTADRSSSAEVYWPNSLKKILQAISGFFSSQEAMASK
jgi:hypothetical protein